jgi:hypothetical protein
MKRSPILMSIFVLLCSVATERADDIPKQFNFDRYSAMMNRSPFAVATAVAPPAATPNFAKDLYVANAGKLREFDTVTLANTADKNFKLYLSTKEPVDGYSIANIEWSDKVGATKVTISKDGQFATLTFNQALLSTGPPSAPVVVPAAGAAPAQTNLPKPPVPNVPTPAPRVRGVIQRNPGAAPTPPPARINPPPSDEE